MREYLETHFDKSILSNSLCDLASIILKNNYFENQELKYLQKRGFVIATKFAPPHSSLFMTELEKRIFQNSQFNPFLWLRYLDEIFGIWTQCSQKLNKLFNCINSLHPTVNFTKDYSTTEINFLGVTVTKVGNKLETDLYCKPTDTHQYHDAQSCHRNVYKGSIAYRHVVRFTRIDSTEEKLNNHLEQLKQRLIKHGCKEDHVHSEVERIKVAERTVSFQIRDKKVDDSKTIVLTYHPALNQLCEIL